MDQAADDPGLIQAFATAMAALGPFEVRPRLAAGVSGGADSMALACLADAWARGRGGMLLALIVDHGLRPEAAGEAALTADRLAGLGIAARILRLTDLAPGTAIAERARAARYQALTRACADSGIAHLLLGHHAADQAETVMIRVLGGSGGRGLAGMPALTETRSPRLLRPLLDVPPGLLRGFLRRAGVEWVEDPSNRDPRAQRVRLRQLRADPDGTREGTRVLRAAARAAGAHRAAGETAVAAILAARVTLWPEGVAYLTPGAIAPEALAELLRVIAGANFGPGLDRVAALAAHPAPATLWGVRLLAAGRLGDGFLLIREERAMAPPVAAEDGALWDGRFRLRLTRPRWENATLGALGAGAAGVRRHSCLPAAALRTLPALWRGNILVAVPHLGYPAAACEGARVVFNPPQPLAGATFLPT